MWYIIDCDNDVELIVGFNKAVSKDTYIKALEDVKILEILKIEKIKTGDAFYITIGRVHDIGAGIVLAEI